MQSLREATSASKSRVKSFRVVLLEDKTFSPLSMQSSFTNKIYQIIWSFYHKTTFPTQIFSFKNQNHWRKLELENTSFPNFFLSYKSLPSWRWQADLEWFLLCRTKGQWQIKAIEKSDLTNLYCICIRNPVQIKTFQIKRFLVSASVLAQQSQSPSEKDLLFCFFWLQIVNQPVLD